MPKKKVNPNGPPSKTPHAILAAPPLMYLSQMYMGGARQPLKLLSHEHWCPDNLLYHQKNHEKEQNRAFEGYFEGLYGMYRAGWIALVKKSLQEAKDDESLIKTLSRTQMARLHFLGAQCALHDGDFAEADFWLIGTERYILKDDWLTQMQVNHLKGVCAFRRNLYIQAAAYFGKVLDEYPRGVKVPFLWGNPEAFFCNMRLQQAQALRLLGYFEEAQALLLKMRPAVSQWLRANKPPTMKRLSPTKNMGFWSLQGFDKDQLQQADQNAGGKWLWLAHAIPWQMAMNEMFKIRLQSLHWDSKAWRATFEALCEAANSSQQFSSVWWNAPEMHVLAAEMALETCRYVDYEEWPHWIKTAHELLAVADAVAEFAHKDRGGMDEYHFYHTFITLTRQMYLGVLEAELDQRPDRLEDLLPQVKAQQQLAEKGGAILLNTVARQHFLLGEIHGHLDEFVDALDHYQKARQIFDDVSNFPRCQETQQAISDLRDRFRSLYPGESLDYDA
jgi:hypothetical protein